MQSELAKLQPPTILQINGPVGYNKYWDYCLDLKDSDIYKHLNDKGLAVTSANGVYGIPNCVEGYGIIYNNAIMQKYFSLSDKSSAVAVKSAMQSKISRRSRPSSKI